MTTASTILDTEISDDANETASKLLESAQYTTLALYALSNSLRDDYAGADMIAAFASRFASHEATTL